MTTSVIYKVDYENNAETWWDAFQDTYPTLSESDPEVCDLCRQLERNGSVEVCDPQAIERLDAFLTSLPGWDGGPEYAPHPFVVQAQ